MKKYKILYNDLDIEKDNVVSEKRVIEYALNRLEANENERTNYDFDTYNMTIQNAIKVIEDFNEKVIIK